MSNADPTFLVAEDNENDLILLRHGLLKAGLQMSLAVARDGEEAIRSLKESYATGSLPDLILLDLNMPKFTGFEVLQWIREQPNLRRLIVVIFTTSSLKADVSRAYDLGANSYLVKPLDNDSLADLMKTFYRYWVELNKGPECAPDRCEEVRPKAS